jgi:hypothetical protein
MIIIKEDYVLSDDKLLNQLFTVEKRPFVIINQHFHHGIEKGNFVVVAPTIAPDFERLVEINANYLNSCQESHQKVFLERKYGNKEEFEKKLEKLNERLSINNLLKPILYSIPDEIVENEIDGDEPHFESSLIFTTLLYSPAQQTLTAVGDIWLSFMTPSDYLTERSTMIDVAYQSRGIGQTAVKNLYELVVDRWMGEKIHLIDYKTMEVRRTEHCFQGVISYVDHENYKSIGNNVKSGNTLLEIGFKEMLVFRGVPKSISLSMLSFPWYYSDLEAIVEGLVDPGKDSQYQLAKRRFINLCSEKTLL